MPKNATQISTTVHPDLKELTHRLAKHEGTTISALVTRLILREVEMLDLPRSKKLMANVRRAQQQPK